MIRQVHSHVPEIADRFDSNLSQGVGSADAREHQEVGRVDSACAQYDLAGMQSSGSVFVDDFHSDHVARCR